MKYFNPTYWFKLWVLSAPLFNSENKGIYAKSIDNNQKIKDWISKDITSLESINEQSNLTNWNTNYQSYNLNETNQNIDPFYQSYLDSTAISELETINHKHRYEKSRKKHKRENINNSYIEYSHPFLGLKVYYFYFIPEDHDKLINLIRSFEYLVHPTIFNFVNLFKEKFKDMLNTCDNKDALISEDIRTDGGFWCSLWEFFLDSSFKETCPNNHYTKKIKIQQKSIFSSDWETTNDGLILSTSKNKYFDNLSNDFNKELYINRKNIGLIEDNDDILILKEIKKHYPNLNIDLFEIFEKKDYSFFSPIFEAKIKPKLIKNIDNAVYSYCFASKINIIFLYLTKTKLNEISNKIADDQKFKNWKKDINYWNSTLSIRKEELNNDIELLNNLIYNNKNLTAEEKNNRFIKAKNNKKDAFKNKEKIQIDNFLRDKQYVMDLINSNFKIDELNNNIQGIKSEFEKIKSQVNELENRVQNLDSRVKGIENTSTWNCANIVAFGGGYVSVIPTIGTVGSAVATLTSAACAIAGV